MNELLVKSLIATELCQGAGVTIWILTTSSLKAKYDAKRDIQRSSQDTAGSGRYEVTILSALKIRMATRMSDFSASVHWKESSPGWNVTAFI